jgi:hypothetical protein
MELMWVLRSATHVFAAAILPTYISDAVDLPFAETKNV